MSRIRRLAVMAATALALTGGGLTAASLTSAAQGDKTGFCKTTEHYTYHYNDTGQLMQCRPHRGSNGRTVWDWINSPGP